MAYNDDQPQWIRDLYRDIYPQAPIYPVGPRTRVMGSGVFRSPTNRVNMFSPPSSNGGADLANAPIPDNLMGPNADIGTPPPPPISSGQASDDVTSLLNRFPGRGQDVARFLQSGDYQRGLAERGLNPTINAPFPDIQPPPTILPGFFTRNRQTTRNIPNIPTRPSGPNFLAALNRRNTLDPRGNPNTNYLNPMFGPPPATNVRNTPDDRSGNYSESPITQPNYVDPRLILNYLFGLGQQD